MAYRSAGESDPLVGMGRGRLYFLVHERESAAAALLSVAVAVAGRDDGDLLLAPVVVAADLVLGAFAPVPVAVAVAGCDDGDLLLIPAVAAADLPAVFVPVPVAVADAVGEGHGTLWLVADMHNAYATTQFESIYAHITWSKTHSNRLEPGRSLISSS